jgi:hypothetical protein
MVFCPSRSCTFFHEVFEEVVSFYAPSWLLKTKLEDTSVSPSLGKDITFCSTTATWLMLFIHRFLEAPLTGFSACCGGNGFFLQYRYSTCSKLPFQQFRKHLFRIFGNFVRKNAQFFVNIFRGI